MTLQRADGTFACPICGTGTMCEHDAGYDECSDCTFFAIYWDGVNHDVPAEQLEAIYASLARDWKEQHSQPRDASGREESNG